MIREEIRGEQWTFPFVLYRPQEIQMKYPLIIQLHGAGEAGYGKEDLAMVERHGFSKIMHPKAGYPCIVAMPQCVPSSFWIAEIPNIRCFIEQLVKAYSVDAERIYLTGISMGAYGTWLTASRYPELFAAIAPVCGGGMVWKAPVLKIPIWAFHGTEDSTVYPTESINMIQKVRSTKDENQDVRLTMLDGVAHNAWDYTFDETLLQWLLSKRQG